MSFISQERWNALVAATIANGKAIDRLTGQIQALIKQEAVHMSAIEDAITALGTQVDANTSAEASSAQLLSQLAGMIQSNANDPQVILQLAAKLKTSADALAASIVANTPAAPPAPAPAPSA